MIRPWQLGDKVAFVWLGRKYGRGTILDINDAKDLAQIRLKCCGFIHIYPISQLRPSGLTFWTFRHLILTLLEIFSIDPAFKKRKL